MPFPALLLPLIFWTAIAALSSWAVSRALPLRANNSIVIDAPAEKVWDVVTDLDRLSEWNEHIIYVRANGEIAQGMRVKMKTQHPESSKLTATFRPVVSVFRPEREVTWSAKIIAKWLLAVTDTTELEPLEDGRTKVHQEMHFSGVLSPGVPFLASISRLKENSNLKLKELVEGNAK
ncbi:hypothetical protein CDES_06245 [Corynebacterium deserti GIMN1.010]|uniref:Coenzyme Q-binding protein COQ10 START domain-containing protein n=1 Tax=Corynebacterium deserti GIMN1.010 TaxID=931089 RepID=A0A0M4CFR9_9CORY|nr:SRPBCC domain-containing protein [Corynebacterium deserti]ALC05677.1 hypothetical protein CDES_06245 [Corynebacterium deserti GIMN1.010]